MRPGGGRFRDHHPSLCSLAAINLTIPSTLTGPGMCLKRVGGRGRLKSYCVYRLDDTLRKIIQRHLKRSRTATMQAEDASIVSFLESELECFTEYPNRCRDRETE